jgi:hypothetical protein
MKAWMYSISKLNRSADDFGIVDDPDKLVVKIYSANVFVVALRQNAYAVKQWLRRVVVVEIGKHIGCLYFIVSEYFNEIVSVFRLYAIECKALCFYGSVFHFEFLFDSAHFISGLNFIL